MCMCYNQSSMAIGAHCALLPVNCTMAHGKQTCTFSRQVEGY